ncbi:cell division protein FtsQ/DivIB [Streptosporangium vulgare]|uniref:cell division protein FtsQ/DivIB n=1 Tax=Streptosporangium vulgare TaxID=46190 RepID=UPI0031D2C425
MNGVWRPAFLALLTVGVVGIAAWLVFFSPVLGVREIQVDGNAGLSAEQIRRAAEVPAGMPLATVDVAEVEGRIGRIPQVESVTVSRAWPGTLRVEVVERSPVAVVPVGERSALMDRHGMVTEVKDVAPPALPVLRGVAPGTRGSGDRGGAHRPHRVAGESRPQGRGGARAVGGDGLAAPQGRPRGRVGRR